MTFAYAALTLGAIMLYSAFTDKSFAEIVLGIGEPGTVSTNPTLGEEANTSMGGGSSKASFDLGKKGVGNWHGEPVCNWIVSILKRADADGVHVNVISGFRTYAQQVSACAHTSGPCATPGTSNHEGCTGGKGAIDIDPADKSRFDAWLAKNGRPLVAGDAINDPNHYSRTGH